MEICCDPARLLRFPGYRDRYGEYSPPEDLVEAFATLAKPATLLLVYGTWCDASARIVPEVVKTLELAGNENVWLLAVHVAYSETDPGPFRAGSIEITRYPTIVLLRGHFRTSLSIPGGVEIVRFVEQSMEAGTIGVALAAGG